MSLDPISSIIGVTNLALSTYNCFKDAPAAFDALQREIRSLHDVLSKIQNELLRDEPLSSHTCDGREKLSIGNSEIVADLIEEIESNMLSLEEALGHLSAEFKSLSGGRWLHSCIVPECKATPFTRLHDLQHHIKTMHKLDRRELESSWPILLQRIKADLDRCRKALCTEQSERACSVDPSQIDCGSRDPDLTVARTYLLWVLFSYSRHFRCNNWRFIKWRLNLISVTGFLSVLLMSASFLWLDQIAALEEPSNLVNWIISESVSILPAQVAGSFRHVQQSSIIAIYLISCALYSISTIAWFIAMLRKSSMYYWYIFGLATTIFWTLLGVTPAELFMVFLPLSVSIGICVQTVCGGPLVNPPCKVGVRCQNGSGKLTLIPVRPIQNRNSCKPTLEQYHEDLERNLKG